MGLQKRIANQLDGTNQWQYNRAPTETSIHRQSSQKLVYSRPRQLQTADRVRPLQKNDPLFMNYIDTIGSKLEELYIQSNPSKFLHEFR